MLFSVVFHLRWRTGQVLRRLAGLAAGRMHRATLAHVGDGTRFQRGVVFDPPARVVIGRNCLVSAYVRATSETGQGHLQLGDGVQVNRAARLDMTGGLWVGEGALISEEVVIYTHDHGRDPRAPARPCPKVIGAGVWIGARALVLPGCRKIGAYAIIGAGAVVTADVPAGAVVAGNPARIVGHAGRAA